jgi:hypothetical protein
VSNRQRFKEVIGEAGGFQRSAAIVDQSAPIGDAAHREAHASGVSWPAVIAGAFVAAALSLVLLSLGTGLGLSSVSPWSNDGASNSAIGTGAIVWLICNEIISSAMGGYLAGRLRTKWAVIHSDEVYFRDTAHGFLVWAVAVVMTAAFLATAATAMVGGAGRSRNSSSAGPDTAINGYFVDSLFRSSHAVTADDQPVRFEASRILENALTKQDISGPDKAYLTQLVANKTGLSQADSEQRVSTVLSDARQALESSRKAGAHLLLWLFVALLIGAFSASLAATIGGRQRDHVRLA